jgi:multidrug efflux pump subunit AcrB
VKTVPGVIDVTTDREQGGLQANVTIDRKAAARLGVRIQDIDNALNNAFSQRQISTIYTTRNQYRVILEVDDKFKRDPSDLSQLYVAGGGNTQVPLSTVAKVERGIAPLVVNHQGQFPSVTTSFNLPPGVSLGQGVEAVNKATGEMGMPLSIRGTFMGTAQAFNAALANQPLLILAALVAVYIVLGMLYESYIHPITILSTLPSAGMGAVAALLISGSELSIIAIIGIILLIGIVKKNGIMMVDFALEARRAGDISPREAIFQACRQRFRPIMMTTMAALLGALPLALGSGVGFELRRPLGISIIGGLLISQILTLYTTPVIYLYLDRWGFKRAARRHP